jgi:hypothetical protein
VDFLFVIMEEDDDNDLVDIPDADDREVETTDNNSGNRCGPRNERSVNPVITKETKKRKRDEEEKGTQANKKMFVGHVPLHVQFFATIAMFLSDELTWAASTVIEYEIARVFTGEAKLQFNTNNFRDKLLAFKLTEQLQNELSIPLSFWNEIRKESEFKVLLTGSPLLAISRQPQVWGCDVNFIVGLDLQKTFTTQFDLTNIAASQQKIDEQLSAATGRFDVITNRIGKALNCAHGGKWILDTEKHFSKNLPEHFDSFPDILRSYTLWCYSTPVTVTFVHLEPKNHVLESENLHAIWAKLCGIDLLSNTFDGEKIRWGPPSTDDELNRLSIAYFAMNDKLPLSHVYAQLLERCIQLRPCEYDDWDTFLAEEMNTIKHFKRTYRLLRKYHRRGVSLGPKIKELMSEIVWFFNEL